MAGRVAQDFYFVYHKCDVSSQLIMKSWSRINNLTKNKKNIVHYVEVEDKIQEAEADLVPKFMTNLYNYLWIIRLI